MGRPPKPPDRPDFKIRRNGLTLEILVRNLPDVRIEHGLDQLASVDRSRATKSDEHPRIIYSEALV